MTTLGKKDSQKRLNMESMMLSFSNNVSHKLFIINKKLEQLQRFICNGNTYVLSCFGTAIFKRTIIVHKLVFHTLNRQKVV